MPLIEDLIRLAHGAGELLRAYFERPLQVSHKGSVDLVTEADERAEAYLLAAVRERWPADSILAEESGAHAGAADARWYIDPLDGTTNFAHGLPHFAVSLAFADSQGLRLGVIYDPMRDETFAAERGRGASLNGRPIAASKTDRLVESLLVTGFPYDRATNPENNLDYFNHFALRCRGIRRLGSAALDLAYVAAGRMDAYWEVRLQPWDLAAGMLIAREAGAVVSRLYGEKDVLQPPCNVLAANPALHALMLAEAQELKATRA